MSNQVYANGQQKYYAQPGLTEWVLPATQTFDPPPLITNVVFDPVPIINQGGQVNLSFNGTTNEFTAEEAGMYRLSFISSAQMAGSANFEYSIGIQLIAGHLGADGDVVAQWEGSAVMAVSHRSHQQVAATVFLPQGSTFRVYLLNYRPDTLGLLDSATRLFVTKIS